MACIDRAGYNLKAENLLPKSRDDGLSSLPIFCEAHICSNAIGHTLNDLMPMQVTDIIAASLRLRHGNCLNLFRQCLQEEISSKLKIMHGTIDVPAARYRQHIMDIFMSGSSTKLIQQVLVCKLPNGDWRKHDVVEYFVSPLCDRIPTKDAISLMLSTGLVQALLSSKPHVATRHRWTGLDICLDEIGRLEAIHGLFSSTFSRFLTKFQRSGGAGVVRAGSRNIVTNAEPDTHAEVPVADAIITDASDVNVNNPDAPAPARAPEVAAEAPPQAIERHLAPEQHSQQRKKAQTWLSGSPLTDLVLFWIALRPLANLMTDLLTISGEGFELAERAKLLRPRADHAPAQRVHRNYPLTLAADGVLEATFYTKLEGCFRSALWEVVLRKKKPHPYR